MQFHTVFISKILNDDSHEYSNVDEEYCKNLNVIYEIDLC